MLGAEYYMIRLENVGKVYGEGGSKVVALQDISIEIPSGKFVAIVGKSGSGKSTLLNLIGALDTSSTGKVYSDDICLNNLNADQMSDYRSQHLGFVFQSFYLEPKFTVMENVEMPLVIAGINKADRRAISTEVVKKFGIEDKLNQRVNTLSGGQKQRVSIARALAHSPNLVLADEPTGNLDSKNGAEVIAVLREICNDGKTVILVTHNMDDAKQTDMIIEIEDGRISSTVDNVCKELT